MNAFYKENTNSLMNTETKNSPLTFVVKSWRMTFGRIPFLPQKVKVVLNYIDQSKFCGRIVAHGIFENKKLSKIKL